MPCLIIERDNYSVSIVHPQGSLDAVKMVASRCSRTIILLLLFLLTAANLQLSLSDFDRDPDRLPGSFIGQRIENPKIARAKVISLRASSISSTIGNPSFQSTRIAKRTICPVHVFYYDMIPTSYTKDLEVINMLMLRNTSGLENPVTEMVLAKLFETTPCRTQNPREADLYLVPYLHASDCRWTVGYAPACGQVSDSRIDLLLANLTFWNETTQNRHIFLLGHGASMSKPQLANMPLTLTLGPRFWTGNRARDLAPPSKGSIVVPIATEFSHLQPSAIRSRRQEWWTRPRKYSFSYFFGRSNAQATNDRRLFRFHFEQDILAQGSALVGGLPYRMVQINYRNFTEEEALSFYQESTFCPVLSGDMCWQARFFHVLLSGCLPVVLEWETFIDRGKSWFVPTRKRKQYVAAVDCYPFFKKPLESDEGIGVDYELFVVRAKGNVHNTSDVSSLRLAMEGLLKDTRRLEEMQLNLMRFAPLLSYGLGKDAHSGEDAFALIVKALGRYVHSLDVERPSRSP